MAYIAQNKKYMVKNTINYALKSNANFGFGIRKCDKRGVVGAYHSKLKQGDIIEVYRQAYVP